MRYPVVCGGVRLPVLLNQELGTGMTFLPSFCLDYTLYPVVAMYGCIRDV